jgi:pimeloyl-ACP methyl ester carboxylesterase
MVKFLSVFIIAVAGGFIWLIFQPLNLHDLQSHPEPAWSYEQAYAALQQRIEENGISDDCQTQFMTNGNQTAKVIVLFHDYGNCPRQFTRLTPLLYNNNCNILLARLPYHGTLDRLDNKDFTLTAERLTVFADSIADIAVMLGKKVVVGGIGAGAVLAAWTGLVRPDIESVIMITPAFHYTSAASSHSPFATRILLTLPNRRIWKDPVLKEEGTPAHIYPRYSTRAIGQIMRLGIDVITRLEKNASLTKKYLVITNENDSLYDNRKTRQFVNLLKNYATEVATYAYPRRVQLGNDIIDPSRTYEQVDKVYPLLVEMISRH